MQHPQLDLELCRERQERLRNAVTLWDVDLIVLSRPESIQWATGWRTAPCFAPVAVIDREAIATIVLPERDAAARTAVDRRVGYEVTRHGTLVDEQRAASSDALIAAVRAPRTIACEFSAVGQHLLSKWSCKSLDVEPTLFQLRRKKDADELAMLGKAASVNRSLYAAARQIICPGTNELDVYGALSEIAVQEMGEPPTYFGQDFQCNSRGGPPRNRCAEAGELYILDLGVGYRGYYSDNARTFAVGGNPTTEQQRAWQAVADVFDLIQSRVKSGVNCKLVFDEVQILLDRQKPWVFDHHLGHGMGLAPHEAPHLNPRWDDHFEEGDVIAVEPGLYHPELRTGVRLEQNYRVTAAGAELLSDWPLGLC